MTGMGWEWGTGTGKGMGTGMEIGTRMSFYTIFCTIYPCVICSIYVYPVSAVDVYVTTEKGPWRKIKYKFIRLFSNSKGFNSMVG
jgi:tRNA(Arg) A34 adenosine deaminase TadA